MQHDYVVCLECGFRGQAIRRHLSTRHELTPEQYRVRWKLPADHPITAPAYSELRSTMAKQIGFGRRPRQAHDLEAGVQRPTVRGGLDRDDKGRVSAATATGSFAGALAANIGVVDLDGRRARPSPKAGEKSTGRASSLSPGYLIKL